jgi:hypothetical protein
MQKASLASVAVTVLASALMVIGLVRPAGAHMDAGVDLSVGPYLIDTGWSPNPPVAGEPVALSFGLGDKETEQGIPYESAWVRIASGSKIVFAGAVRASGGTAIFTQTFPTAGEYEMTVRFLATDGGTLAEQTVPIIVAVATAAVADEKAETTGRSFPAAFALGGALVVLELLALSHRARPSGRE